MGQILDSGDRREFASGAVRDMGDKGRCDLLPLDVVERMTGQPMYGYLDKFKESGNVVHLLAALHDAEKMFGWNVYTMILEVSYHFRDGAEKYGVGNWQKGIDEWSFLDSAVRHLTKYLRGDTDEPHDRAFIWNIMCLIWTHEHIAVGAK